MLQFIYLCIIYLPIWGCDTQKKVEDHCSSPSLCSYLLHTSAMSSFSSPGIRKRRSGISGGKQRDRNGSPPARTAPGATTSFGLIDGGGRVASSLHLQALSQEPCCVLSFKCGLLRKSLCMGSLPASCTNSILFLAQSLRWRNCAFCIMGSLLVSSVSSCCF